MQDIPDWAGRYVGIPYEEYGRTQLGADCWGIVRLILTEQAGLDLPENPIDPTDGSGIERLIGEHLGPWNVIIPGDEQPFDVILMSGCYGKGFDMRRATMHVGLVLRPGIMIHSTSNTGAAVIERYRERLRGHDIMGFYRHRTLDV